MRRIEGPPVEGISESTQKRGRRIKGIPALKDKDTELVREAVEMGWMERLPVRQKKTLIERFGELKTLKQVGAGMGNITREAVRQAENKALRNLGRIKEGKPPLISNNPRTDISVAEVVSLYEGGKTYKEIADLLACNINTVKNRLNSAGTLRRRRGRRKIEIDIDRLVRQYFVEGMSATEIAKPLGISNQTVLNRLKEAEHQIRGTGRPRKK